MSRHRRFFLLIHFTFSIEVSFRLLKNPFLFCFHFKLLLMMSFHWLKCFKLSLCTVLLISGFGSISLNWGHVFEYWGLELFWDWGKYWAFSLFCWWVLEVFLKWAIGFINEVWNNTNWLGMLLLTRIVYFWLLLFGLFSYSTHLNQGLKEPIIETLFNLLFRYKTLRLLPQGNELAFQW